MTQTELLTKAQKAAGLVDSDKPADAKAAKKLFTELLKTMPNNPLFHCGLALALKTLNDLDAAELSLNRALELNPNVGVAYVQRAELNVKRGKNAEARADYDKALPLLGAEAAAAVKKTVALINN